MPMLEEENDMIWIWWGFQTPTTKKIKTAARNGIFMWEEKLEHMEVSMGSNSKHHVIQLMFVFDRMAENDIGFKSVNRV